jgi:predicted ATPase
LPAESLTHMSATFIQKIRLDGFLSFAPGSDALELRPLNVLIGANASGKSNLIEAFELLRVMPTNLADAIREGGGPAEWIWKGDRGGGSAEIEVEVEVRARKRPLRHRLAFTAVSHRVEVSDEAIEEIKPAEGKEDVFFLYRFRRGRPVVNSRSASENGGGRKYVRRNLPSDSLSADQSILSQLKDADHYPEITEIGVRYGTIQSFREWTFGRSAALRQPQPADLPEDRLLPDARNLALVLNQIEHKDGRRFNEVLKRFFPRFQRMSTKISGGTVQFYLHESGFKAPIPPTRLSDGTLRFVALLATLLAPSPPPLVCIEEPELGLHPDAVALIADILVEASDRMQLVVTTHSDALVSALTGEPDAVIACERPGAGTILHRLDPTKLARWLDDYRLGELWRMGELGANP